MNVTDMVGPGGPKGCSVMTCLDTAVVEKNYVVAHVDQPLRGLRYRFCLDHRSRGFESQPHVYPNYELTSTRSL